ncbi:hypothetical protein AAVH_05787 [Aphelenchoides avenae]|nr:hypothetical protein AAVH_05787 [Aphelenchus avenae]
MSQAPEHDNAAGDLQASTSQNPATNQEDIIRALEGMHGDISKLRQRLHCSYQHSSENSKTYLNSCILRLCLNTSKDNGCRVLTENLHAAVPRSILINDVFVDIFLCLGRVSLDAVQLTCARFDALVQDYLKNFCYRTMIIKIIDERHTDFKHALPQNHASPPVYGIQIAALHDVLTDESGEADTYRLFTFESHNLEDVLTKLAEKMTMVTYVLGLELYGVPNVIERLIERHQSCAKRMIIGVLRMRGYEGDFVLMPSLLDSLSTFRAVNGVTLDGRLSPNVNTEFFKRCREMSIFDLRFHGPRHVEVSIDALLDYCFEPTRKGLENTPRRVIGLASLDREMPSRLLEVSRHEAREPGPDISIEVWPKRDGFVLQPLEEEVRMRYAKVEMVRPEYGDDVDKVYLAQPFEGVDVTCSFFGYYAQFTVQYN